MSETPISTIEPTLHGKNSKTDGTSSANPIQNITPPIDTVPTPATLDGTPKRRNYLPWLLGILALLIAISVLTFYQITKGNNKTQPSSGSTQSPVLQEQTTVAVTNIDMSSWKTYTNSGYGYSLKYPNKVSIRESKESDYIFFELPIEKEDGNITPTLWITHLKSDTSLNPKDFYVKKTKETEVEHANKNLPPVIPPVETKETKINGLDAFQYTASAGDGNMLHTYLKSGKVIVDISYYSDLDNPNFPNNKKNKYIFDRILSTFKLVDKELINFLRKQLNLSENAIIEIEKDEGNYVLGSGGEPEGGGFYWAAAKKDGQWNYAFLGNGIPECSEVEVFPVGTFKSALPGGKFDECYNDKNELIDRKTGLLIK